MSTSRFSFALSVLAGAVLLFACGGEEGESGGKKLTIWWAQWAPADGLAELGREFEREKGIPVEVHQTPWTSYQEQVFMNFGNKKTDFDIVIGDSQWIGRGATEGLYLELTDWLPTAIDMSTVHPRAAKYLCEYPSGSGKFWAAPCETDAIGVIYRKDWFEDAGERERFQAKYGYPLAPPGDWSQFRDIAEFFHRPGEQRFGCAILTGRGYDTLTMGFQQFLWAFGGAWCDEKTGKVAGSLNGPGAVEAVQFMRELLKFSPNGGKNFDYAKALEVFKNGSTAMSLDYFAFFPGVAEEMKGKAGFAVMPGHEGRRSVSLGGQGMSISAKTPAAQQDLAKEFIRWFLQVEVQKKWITKPAGFTASTEILKSEAFRNATPYNAPFADSLDHVRDFWNVPVFNELLSAAQRVLGELVDDPELAIQPKLDELAAEHEKILREAKLLP